MPKVSIIVPVYKAEKYLSRCLDSILAQTMPDFEVLLIDDGSPDRSGEICDEYARKDPRIRVFHKENGGVASARQMGLDNSQGKYIIHADPDDWVESNWLECLLTNAMENDSDMVICDFTRHFDNRKTYFKQRPQTLACEDIAEDLISGKIWGSCCNKLVLRSCFEEFLVSFIPSMNIWEDLYVTCALIEHNIKVSYVEMPLYHYDSYSNNNSLVRFRKKCHIQSLMTFIDHFEKVFSQPRYEEGWYSRKCDVKKNIYYLQDSSYDIVSTYAEINQRFINENKGAAIGTEFFYILLCLKGVPLRIVHTISKLFEGLLRIKTVVLHFLRNIVLEKKD